MIWIKTDSEIAARRAAAGQRQPGAKPAKRSRAQRGLRIRQVHPARRGGYRTWDAQRATLLVQLAPGDAYRTIQFQTGV